MAKQERILIDGGTFGGSIVKDCIMFEQGTQEWLDWRLNGITATEASAAVGASKWATPLSVYNDKLNPKPHETNKYEEWGSLLEDTIKFGKFAKMHPEFEVKQGHCFENEWRKCSLDGELWQDDKCVAILEIKTGRDASAWAPIPDYYKAQVQWQMHVTGIHKAYFAVLINGCDYFERFMEYDPDYCEHLECLCSLLWHDIINKTPPSPIKADIDQPVLVEMALDKEDRGDAFEVSEDDYTRYALAKDAFEKADTALKAIKLKLTQYFLKAKRITYKGKSFGSIVQMSGREGIDKKMLQEKFPDVYKEVLKVGQPTTYTKFG